MEHADAVVGNSSSGLYETPSLGTPTVNIGDRQKGRLRAVSVLDCAARAADIERAIRAALELDCAGVVNPYGDGRSAERIAGTLASVGDFRALLRKTFHDA
jgi:UDP-N-acetylglucosamine 2-epimerase